MCLAWVPLKKTNIWSLFRINIPLLLWFHHWDNSNPIRAQRNHLLMFLDVLHRFLWAAPPSSSSPRPFLWKQQLVSVATWSAWAATSEQGMLGWSCRTSTWTRRQWRTVWHADTPHGIMGMSRFNIFKWLKSKYILPFGFVRSHDLIDYNYWFTDFTDFFWFIFFWNVNN